MQSDPYFQRPWAELLFYFAATVLMAVAAAYRFVASGDWLSLIVAAMGGIGTVVIAFVIWRKASTGRSQTRTSTTGH